MGRQENKGRKNKKARVEESEYSRYPPFKTVFRLVSPAPTFPKGCDFEAAKVQMYRCSFLHACDFLCQIKFSGTVTPVSFSFFLIGTEVF